MYSDSNVTRVGVNPIPELELQLNSNSGIGIGIEISGIENGIGIEIPGIGIGIRIKTGIELFATATEALTSLPTISKFSFNRGGHNLSCG